MSETKSPHAGLTRRSFLKTTGAVAGAAAVAGGATPALQALAADSETSSNSDGEKIMPGRCYFGGCFSCNYNVTVRDGRAVKVSPDPDALFGRRPCLKGYSLPQRMYSQERIKYPMKRVGERGENQWERISWEEAIATITEKWKGYIDQYGGQSILVSTGSSGARFTVSGASRLENILQFTNVEMCADWAVYHGLQRVYGNPATGIMTAPGNEPFEEDIFNAKTVFMWGNNLSETYTQRWRYLMEAQEQGARIISIDPNETTVSSHADEWYTLRPGSDPALMLSMVQEIIAEGLQDTAYLKRDTVGPFLVRDDTKEFLRMSDLGVEPTEGPVNPMTRKPTIVDPPVVWDAASGKEMSSAESSDPKLEGSWVVNGFNVTTAYSLMVESMQEYKPEDVADIVDMSVDDIRRLARLAVDGPVSHMFGLGSQAYDNGLQFGSGLGLLLAVTGMVGKPGAGVQATAFMGMRNASFLFPTGTFTTTIPVLHLPEVMETGKFKGKDYPPFKSLYIRGSAFVGGRPDKNKLIAEIIDKLEFIVCLDVAFTDSALYADIVLPAAHYFEVEDVYGASLSYHMQHSPKIVEPAFEAKPDLQVAKLLAEGLGVGKYFEGDDESWLREQLDFPALAAQGITLDALREKKDMRFLPAGVYYADGKFSTPTGKVEFYCEKPLPRHDLGLDLDVAPERLPRFYPPYEAWPGTEAMKKYPLILIPEHSRGRFHTGGFDGVWLNEIERGPIVRMNVDDAQARGIEDGDDVEVYNDRGHGVARAVLDAGKRPGMLQYPKGLQGRQYKSGDLASLCSLRMDPFAVNSSFGDTCVEVRKWDGGSE